MKIFTLFASALVAGVVSGCAPSGTAALPATASSTEDSPANLQSKLCEVSDWRRDVVEKACTPGQKVAFLPDRWGNEQLPVIFAAVNCDLRYSVALTAGGVACIFAPLAHENEEKAGTNQTSPASGDAPQ